MHIKVYLLFYREKIVANLFLFSPFSVRGKNEYVKRMQLNNELKCICWLGKEEWYGVAKVDKYKQASRQTNELATAATALAQQCKPLSQYFARVWLKG